MRKIKIHAISLIKNIRRPMCLFCLIFVIFLYILTRGSDSLSNVSAFADNIGEGTELTLTGILEKKEIKETSTLLLLSDVSYSIKGSDAKGEIRLNKKISVYLKDPSPLPRIGSRVCVKGNFSPYERACNTGNFDAMKYYSLRGIYGKLYDSRIIAVSREYSELRDFLYELKERTKRVYHSYLKDNDPGTLSALILGDKTELDSMVKESYQNASISHILSLSGLHIATLGLMLLSLLKRLGIKPFLSSILASFVMICYCLMTGLSISSVRALIMFLLGVLAGLIGRTYDLMSSAALSAVLILLTEPYYLYDSGFLLSFSAIMGINYIYPSIFGLLSKLVNITLSSDEGNLITSFGKKILSSLIFSLSIQLATLPVTQYSFFRLSLIGTLCNLIVIPLMSVLLFLGVGLSVLGNLALSLAEASVLKGFPYTVTDSLCLLCSRIIHLILSLYDKLALISSGIPGNIWVCGKPSVIRCCIYYFMLTCFVILSSAITSKNLYFNQKNRRFLLRLILLIPVLSVYIISIRPDSDIELHTISVGQGDCTLIYGKKTPTILIDAGSTDIKNVGKYRILPCLMAHGISEIDLIFISHFDSDHVNGILELLNDELCVIKADRIILSEAVPFSENKNYEALLSSCKAKDIPVLYMDADDTLTFKDQKDIRITCLSPDVSGSDSWRSRDINDNSLVLKFEYGDNFSALFTGDISKSVENDLLKNKEISDQTGRISYLKCAHHGSSTASSLEFLSCISPLMSTISCGVDNSYGHPHKETLEALKALNTPYYITSESGEITVSLESEGMDVSTFLLGF
ncbi:MAG: DNA internalization-related competence protein ComEC/Rec2 [Lachnospiraceae bacterium]|nr:DNA internalization-related competence protein ComEC/Rec2 [Lachnospiraceae bacterium]